MVDSDHVTTLGRHCAVRLICAHLQSYDLYTYYREIMLKHKAAVTPCNELRDMFNEARD